MKKRLFALLILFLIFLSSLFVSCDSEGPQNYFSYFLVRNIRTGEVRSTEDYVVCMEKDKNKDFVILNLADIQADRSLNDDTKNLIRTLIDQVNPDLIATTGDMAYGNIDVLRSVCNYIDSLGIPWAPVFGNHDHEQYNCNMEEKCALLESYENCIFKTGPDLGSTLSKYNSMEEAPKLGNYVVDLIEYDRSSFTVVKQLFFLNSGDRKLYDDEAHIGETVYWYGSSDKNYDSLNDRQLKFYRDCVKSVQKYGSGGSVSSAMFFHIPLTAFVSAANAAYKSSYDYFTEQSSFFNSIAGYSFEDTKNSDKWNAGYQNSFGVLREAICSTRYDDHVFEVIKNNTDLVVCGHDHVNNFVINYDGVILCYGTKTGTYSYSNSDIQGGTVIRINSDGDVTVEQILVR